MFLVCLFVFSCLKVVCTSNDEYWVVATPWSLVENGISVCGVTVFIHPPVCMIVGSESLLDDTEFGFCCKMQFYAAPEKKKKKEKGKKI